MIRQAKVDDVPQLFKIRVSVRENLMCFDEMAQIGVTPESGSTMTEQNVLRGWTAEPDARTVGFCLAERTTREIMASFVVPGYQGHGYGSMLLAAAVNSLTADSRKPIRLSTGPDSRAFSFHTKRGWRQRGWVENAASLLHGDVVMGLQP